MNDLVSVITSSYNTERYIAEAVESVIAQTYGNWEMIIADDCSTDGTADIAEKYAEADSRIKVIRLPENRGNANAKNTAMDHAKGRYIAFLDSDDVWLPEKLSTQIGFMQKNGLAFVHSSYLLINSESRYIGSFITKDVSGYGDLLKTCSIGILTAVYDTGMLGKRYFTDTERSEDYLLWLELMKELGEMRCIREPLAKYRIRRGSVSANKFRSAQFHWKIYRDICGMNFPRSLYYFVHYAFYGFKKHCRTWFRM